MIFSALRIFSSAGVFLDDILLEPGNVVHKVIFFDKVLCHSSILFVVPPELNVFIRKLVYKAMGRRGSPRLQTCKVVRARVSATKNAFFVIHFIFTLSKPMIRT